MSTLISEFNKIVETYPNNLAVTYGDQTLTYHELHVKCDKLARRIYNQSNFHVQGPIAIYLDKSNEYIIAILAILKLRCAYLPIDISSPQARVKDILVDSGCKIVISNSDCDGYFEELNVISIDYMDIEGDQINSIPEFQIQPTDLCYLIYTSGTTGKPKGIQIEHQSVINLVNSLNDLIYKRFDGFINIALISTFSFDASVKQIFCALLLGHHLVIASKEIRYFGRKLHNFYKFHQIHLSDGTPTLLKIISSQYTSGKSKVNTFLIGGEMLSWDTVRTFVKHLEYNPTIVNVYGPTECCVDVSAYEINEDEMFHRQGDVPIGRPLRNIFLNIINKNGDIISNEDVGELCVTGVAVGRGYTESSENSNKFTVDPGDNKTRMFHTGDLAKMDKYGYFHVLGRMDDQIKLNGNRIELNEIQTAIHMLGIQQVEVFMVNYLQKDRLCLVICTRMKIDFQEVIRYLRAKLPPYMIPNLYIQIEDIPLTINNKVDKKAMRNLIFDQPELIQFIT